MNIYNNLIDLQKDLNICIEGHCGECKYNIKQAFCTDDLIDKCFKIISELIEEANERKNYISNGAFDGSNSEN